MRIFTGRKQGKWIGLLLLAAGMCLNGSPAYAQQGQLGAPPDPLGSYGTPSVVSCPRATGIAGTCYQISVTNCPEEPTQPANGTAYAKVTCPSGNCQATDTKGTVVFVSGGNGNIFFDTDLRFGLNVVSGVVSAGYKVVQIAFNATPAGWQSGGSNTYDGPRALACLYGTIAQWAHDSFLESGTAFCAVGHSSGTSAIAYSLATEGFGQTGVSAPTWTLAELGSGPPHGDLVKGCKYLQGMGSVDGCPFNNPGTKMVNFSYGQDAELLIDPSFFYYTGNVGNDYCYQCTTNDLDCTTKNLAQWAKDSVLISDLQGDQSYTTYPTDVRVSYGCLDTSAAAPIGSEWINTITTNDPGNGNKPVVYCIGDAGHRVPDTADGAQQMTADIAGYGSQSAGCATQ